MVLKCFSTLIFFHRVIFLCRWLWRFQEGEGNWYSRDSFVALVCKSPDIYDGCFSTSISNIWSWNGEKGKCKHQRASSGWSVSRNKIGRTSQLITVTTSALPDHSNIEWTLFRGKWSHKKPNTFSYGKSQKTRESIEFHSSTSPKVFSGCRYGGKKCELTHIVGFLPALFDDEYFKSEHFSGYRIT